MEEILALVNKLGGVSFATLLAVILWGNWKGIWGWGKDYDREMAAMLLRHVNEKAEWQEGLNFWRDIAIRATGLAQTQGQILKETGKAEELHKHPLG